MKYISSRKLNENSIEFSLSNSEQRDSWLNSSHQTLDADRAEGTEWGVTLPQTIVGVRQRQFWVMRREWNAMWTGRLCLWGMPGQSSMLLCTTHQGRYQLAVHRTWWQSGFGCLAWDLIEISPPVSGDLYNQCWRPGLGSYLNSCPLSNFLNGRKFLPKCWSHLLPHL